jgi:hypothetical protein
MNLDELRRLVSERFEALARYLYPNCRKEGCHLLVGSSKGEPGCSFDINLQTEFFGDWAADSRMQRGGINLWMVARNVGFRTAIQQLANWSGCQLDPAFEQDRTRTGERRKGIFLPPGLCEPTEQDLYILSRSRTIGIDALRIAAARGFVYCFDDELNGRCWLYTDQRRRCALRRRLDNQPFRLRGGSASKSTSCMGSDMRTPMGYQEAELFPCLGIVEGAPDALALIAHAWADGVEMRVAPVCMPCTAANFTESSLAYLQNKRARIFIDDDDAGQEAAHRWAAQLQRADVVVDGFSFTGLVMMDGGAVKDLNDLLKIDYGCWERYRDPVEGVMNFAFGREEDGTRDR